MAGPVEARPILDSLGAVCGTQKGSTMNDLGVRDPFGGVAGIDDDRSVVPNPLVIEIGVVGRNERQIVRFQDVLAKLDGRHVRKVIRAHLVKPRDVRITIGKDGAFVREWIYLKDTLGAGSVWDLYLWPDRNQSFFINVDKKIGQCAIRCRPVATCRAPCVCWRQQRRPAAHNHNVDSRHD